VGSDSKVCKCQGQMGMGDCDGEGADIDAGMLHGRFSEFLFLKGFEGTSETAIGRCETT
jgi:hypothetical protein